MRIHDILLSEPLAIHEPALQVWLARMSPMMRRLALGDDSAHLVETKVAAEKSITFADFINGRRDYEVTPEGIAIIHVNDVLGRGLTGIDRLFGATDYNSLLAELDQAAADCAVRGIFLDIASPGGSVIGAPEAATGVAAAAQRKPVVAYMETIGASAAYYFAAAAHAIVASPSAVVGSIGTIGTFANIGGLLAQMGVKIEQLTGGDLKASGTPFRDMNRAERDFLQGRIDDLSAEFRGWVQQSRPAVADATMRGQWFSGAQGLGLGLVDQTGSRADALAALEALIGFGNRNG